LLYFGVRRLAAAFAASNYLRRLTSRRRVLNFSLHL
jgi:hypothetical protein